MDRKEDGCRLHAAFFAMRNVIHPIAKCVQVDATNGDSVRSNVQQPAKEPFIAVPADSRSRWNSISYRGLFKTPSAPASTFHDQPRFGQSLNLARIVTSGRTSLQDEAVVRDLDQAQFGDDGVHDLSAGERK